MHSILEDEIIDAIATSRDPEVVIDFLWKLELGDIKGILSQLQNGDLVPEFLKVDDIIYVIQDMMTIKGEE